MKITDKERRKYLKEIQELLVCSAKERRRFIKEFESNIDDYISDDPEASIEDLRNAMGSPQEIAEGFIANISPKDIKKRSSIARITLVPITLGVLIIVAVCVLLIFDAYKNRNSRGEVYIIDKGTIYEHETTSSIVY